jgi:GT2 family glycosyltransferase
MNTTSSRHNAVFIIPTLSNTDGLTKLVKTIEKVYDDTYPVIIVNNADKSCEKISGLKNEVIINEGANHGFAKATNDGAKTARELFNPAYLILLNDDISFTEDWVAPCIKQLETNGWAAAAPLLMNKHGKAENYGYRILKKGRVELINEADNETRAALQGLTAAALIIRADTFFALNGFDESFFAYLEDVDLFLRMAERGMKFGLVESANVIHEGQKTSGKMPARKAMLDARNWLRIITKHPHYFEFSKNALPIMVERLRNISGVAKASISR